MTDRARPLPERPAASRTGTFRARGIAATLLLLASTTLGGCSLHVLGRGVTLPFLGPKEGSSGPHGGLLEMREQAALHPREPYWPYRLGQHYLGADSLALAEGALRGSLERSPSYAPALSLLSKLYFEAGRHEEAVALLEPVRSRPEAFPDDVREVLLAGLALHYDALGRPGLARAALPLVSRPDIERAGPAVVYLTLRGESPDSAAGYAAATLREAPRSAVNLNNYGITLLRAGDPEAARRAFTSAVDRDPSLPGPYYNLAILEKYYMLDDVAAARWFGDYWKRSRIDPDSLLGAIGPGRRKALAEGGN